MQSNVGVYQPNVCHFLQVVRRELSLAEVITQMVVVAPT